MKKTTLLQALNNEITTLLKLPFSYRVMYTIVHTEKGYRILKERVLFLDGMQLRFLYDLYQGLVPDLDMVSAYFPPGEFQELLTLRLIRIRSQRKPGIGEKKFMVSEGSLYYGVRASVFCAELTKGGERLLRELSENELFSECMTQMDEQMAQNLLTRRSL